MPARFSPSLRLAAIAADVGHPLHLREAVAALSIGQLAGSLFFQVVGQLMARGALLGRHGLPVSATVVMTAYERLMALAVSLTLALIGGWFVFGRVALDLRAGGAEFAKLAVTATAVTVVGAMFVWGRPLMAALSPRLGARVAYRLGRTATLSAATQICTMAAYVVGAHALEPAIPITYVAAASAVVMLAASLPISLAGWGVREMSAVLTLGAIGMPAEEAFVVAVAVGIASLIVVALLSIFTASSWRGSSDVPASAALAGSYRLRCSPFMDPANRGSHRSLLSGLPADGGRRDGSTSISPIRRPSSAEPCLSYGPFAIGNGPAGD